MKVDFKKDKTLREYGISVGDVLIHNNNSYLVKIEDLDRTITHLENFEISVYRKFKNSHDLKFVALIKRNRFDEIVKTLHRQRKLTKEELTCFVKNIDKFFEPNIKNIVYCYKKGKSYKINRISLSQLKINFDNIVNSTERNFYWFEAPAIEYTKQAWYSMSKRQKRDFEDFLIEVE